MADKQATPDAVVTIRASTYGRSVTVGAFGRSFEDVSDEHLIKRGIKAVWRNETGTAQPAPSKIIPA